jgi:hypothetical protein
MIAPWKGRRGPPPHRWEPAMTEPAAAPAATPDAVPAAELAPDANPDANTATTPAADAGFDAWLDRAWEDHAADPPAVLARVQTEGPACAGDDAAVAALARLGAHLHGTHLAQWGAGRAFQAALGAHPAAGALAREATAVHDAALALAAAGAGHAAGDDAGTAAPADPAATLPPASRVRALALAADHLHAHDADDAAARLAQAQALAASLPLADDDPACRALAVAGNNIAAALEELPQRSPAQRALMLAAAHAGRQWWARAGTWLHVERADHRLAMCHLAAGNAPAALAHAQACLDRVRANGDPPLERFFGLHALALAARALGDEARHGAALAGAQAAFDALDASDQDWCRPSLNALTG